MRLRLLREPSRNGATLGALFVDGVFHCWTLEDVVRDVKVPGETAIPFGRYPVVLTHSPRFNCVLPEVRNVPGFVGVRIHAGNRASDSSGCILVGLDRGDAWIGRSQMALSGLMRKVIGAAAIELVIESA